MEPVIVLGGGVVAGLTSKMLVNNGFKVIRVKNKIDKPLNKIFAISPSSMAWFKSIGLSNFFTNSGYPIKKIDIYYEGEQKRLRFDSEEFYKSALAFMVKEKDLSEAINLSLKESGIKFLYQDEKDFKQLSLDNFAALKGDEEDTFLLCYTADIELDLNQKIDFKKALDFSSNLVEVVLGFKHKSKVLEDCFEEHENRQTELQKG